ncbi:MAG: DUF928 domain-containing protein [Cyanobacteria bacterium P01_D01_bin.156]
MIRSIALVLLSSLVYIGGTLNASAIYAAELPTDIESFHFNPPKDGIPDNTTGGASRNPDRCRHQETATKASNITLLAPNSFMGHTISAQPAFFLYAEATLAQKVFVNIENERGEVAYSGYQSLPTDTGLIRIIFPEDASSLTPNIIYKITVVPVCADILRPDDPALVGYVKRISNLPFQSTNSFRSAFEEAMMYAESGIWYDTLVLLEQTLRDDPTFGSVNAAWNMLLAIGELTQFDLTLNAAPVSDCRDSLCSLP